MPIIHEKKCNNCGKAYIGSGLKYCSMKCANIGHTIKFTQEQIEKIISLYNEGYPMCRLARIYRCDGGPIYKILIKNKVKLRSIREQAIITSKDPERNKRISIAHKGKIFTEEHRLNLSKSKKRFSFSKEFLLQEYVNKNKTCKQVAKEIGCVSEIIRRELNRHNIPRRITSDYQGYWKNRKNPFLTQRNLIDNPTKRPEIRKKLSKIWKTNHKYQANFNLRRDKITHLEKKMFSLLDAIDLSENKHFLFNKYIKTNVGFKFPDFLFPDKKVIIECDGSYWHQNIEKDRQRDNELNNLGFKIYHFNEKQINESLIPILREIL